MVRWTWQKVEEVTESLNSTYHYFPDWELSVAEIVNSFRCAYCTFKGKVKVVPEPYLKWLPTYHVCSRCGNIRLKTIKDVEENGRLAYVHGSTGVKIAPKLFYRLPLGFTNPKPNPIWLSRDYVDYALRTERRGRARKHNPRRVDYELFKIVELTDVFTKYGFDTNLVHERVKKQFKRGYSRPYVSERLHDMEIRGFFWRSIRHNKYFWIFKV